MITPRALRSLTITIAMDITMDGFAALCRAVEDPLFSGGAYSYASTSRTVRREAFHAGRTLASAAKTRTMTSQSSIP